VNIFFFESENNKKQYSLLSLGFSYFTELYEWKGLKKLYAHIIRQIENGLADWPKDFGEVETPLLIKHVKNDVKGRKDNISNSPATNKLNSKSLKLILKPAYSN
jgi:hypothetical protein